MESKVLLIEADKEPMSGIKNPTLIKFIKMLEY